MPLALLIIFGLEPSEWLALLGGALEIAGFALVAVELVRAQRRELGTAGPFQFLITAGRWVRVKIRKLLGKTTVHQGAATLAGTVNMSGRGSVRSGYEGEDFGERLRVLESNFAQLDQEVTQHRQELEQRIEKEADALRSEIVSLLADIEAKEAAGKEAFQASATLQWWGVGIFVVGAMCSAAANVAY